MYMNTLFAQVYASAHLQSLDIYIYILMYKTHIRNNPAIVIFSMQVSFTNMVYI